MPARTRLRRRVRAAALELLAAVMGALPLELASRVGGVLGALAFRVASGERRKALDGLAVAFPGLAGAERWALAERCFRHWGRVAGELACHRELDRRRGELVEWPAEARAVMDRALARGKGVVFVTGHVGSWELLARHVALEGYPAAVIGKETSDPHTTGLVERFRTRGNLEVIWRGRPGAARLMIRALRRNAILGLLIDQDTKVESVWVPFFGRLAKTPRAAADLALRTGAVPLVGFAIRRPGTPRYRITMEEIPLPAAEGEAAVHALTAHLTSAIEAAVRAHPEQWVWMHRRWKSPPPDTLTAT